MYNKCYDLYELRQLTESIFVLGQQMRCLNNYSPEYKALSQQYEDLWKRRDELEHKIVGLYNSATKNDEEYWVI